MLITSSSTLWHLSSSAALASKPCLCDLPYETPYLRSPFSSRSLPSASERSRCSLRSRWRILTFARDVLTSLSQSLLGCWLGEVMTSRVSPLRSW